MALASFRIGLVLHAIKDGDFITMKPLLDWNFRVLLLDAFVFGAKVKVYNMSIVLFTKACRDKLMYVLHEVCVPPI